MPTLTELFVEFSEKGLSTVQATMGKVLEVTIKTEKAAVSLAASFKTAFLGATGVLYGFAAAGIAGSVQGERLSFQVKQLSLQIGSLFVPAVEKAISVTSQLTSYLKGLNGETQNTILKWAGLSGGIALIVSGVGVIPGAILAATSAFKLLGDISGDTIDTIVEGFGRVTDIIIPIGKAIWSGLVEAFHAAMPAIAMVGELLFDTFQEMLPSIMELLGSFGELFKQVWETIAEVVQAVTPIIRAAIGMVLTALKGLAWVLDKLIQSLSWIVKQIKETIHTVREEVAAVAASTGEQPASQNEPDKKPKEVKPKEEKKKPERQQLIPKSEGGFENVASAYGRIAQSVINRFDPAKAAADAKADNQKKIGLLEKLVERVGNPKPAVAGV